MENEEEYGVGSPNVNKIKFIQRSLTKICSEKSNETVKKLRQPFKKGL